MMHSIGILAATLRQQIRGEKAYLGNFWFEIFSKITYNIMFLVFIDQLFRRVGSVAGYSHNDFLCLYLVSQFGFYISYYLLHNSMVQLVRMINTGNLDFVLLRPVPHRAFIYASSFKPIEVLLTCVPMLFIISTQVNFAALHITPTSFALAALVMVSGQIICNTILQVLTLPAFKTGEATDSLNVFYSITSISQVPYDKLPSIMKFLSVSLLPQLVTASATTQVLLGKHDVGATIIFVLCSAVVSLVISRFVWRYALRQYTSASS